MLTPEQRIAALFLLDLAQLLMWTANLLGLVAERLIGLHTLMIATARRLIERSRELHGHG